MLRVYSLGCSAQGLGFRADDKISILSTFPKAASLRKNFLSQRIDAIRADLFFSTFKDLSSMSLRLVNLNASGHTAMNTPDLFRTPKLTIAGPG